jgi:ABC-type nitrate/sulfonate/bicarbonate transport system substrate-binding protein
MQTTADSRSTYRVRLAPSGQGAGDAPHSLALASGIFDRFGLQIETVQVGGGTSRIAEALASGLVDFAVVPGLAFIKANLVGGDLVLLLSLVSTNLQVMFARPEIGEPQQLRGKAIGIQQEGDQTDLLQRQALEQWGLWPGEDVTIKVLGSRSAQWAALERGEIAAFTSTPPLSIQAEEWGYTILHRFGSPGAPYQLGAVATRRVLVDQDRELVRRFVQTTVEAIRVFKSDPSLAIEHIRRMTGIADAVVLRRTYDVFALQMVPRPYPRAEALGAVIEHLALSEPRARSLQPEDLIDCSFLEELEGTALPIV